MKFECSTTQFLKGLLMAVRFIERRPNLAVLNCILIIAENNKLTIRATNIECGVEVSVPAKVLVSGIVSVPGGVLVNFIGNVRDKNISAVLHSGVLMLNTNGISASIKTVPHDDFPILPHISAEKSFSIKSIDIIRAIRNVSYCASTSTVKPELQSVLIYGEAGKLISVATDSFRLAECVVPLQNGDVPHILFPARNALEFIRILDGVSEDIEIYYNENQLSSMVGDVYYTSRLADGTFPNYQQIIPKSFTTEVVVLKEDVAQSLKSLSIFSDKFSQVSFTTEPKQKVIKLSSHNPDIGEQTSTVRATISGEAVSINFNSKYLADSLQPIVGESIRIQLNGPGKPILIRDASDNSFLYLAMPMNR